MSEIRDLITEDLAFLKEKNIVVYFTVASTSGNTGNYLTPIRKFGDTAILGLVSSDINVLYDVMPCVGDLADFIFVDVEKKLHPILNGGEEIESNNFLHTVKQILPERTIYPFTPNDITVQSIWNQVIKDIIDLKNAVVFLIGLGNIGAKIALRLAETGCKVVVKSRTDGYKVYHTVEALNRVKHAGAIGEISVVNSFEKGLLVADIVIFAANAKNVLDNKFVGVLKSKHRLVGVSRDNINQMDLKELPNYMSIDVGVELMHTLKSIVFQFERKSSRHRLGSEFKYVGSGLFDDSEVVYDYGAQQYVGGQFIKGKFKRLSAKELYDVE